MNRYILPVILLLISSFLFQKCQTSKGSEPHSAPNFDKLRAHLQNHVETGRLAGLSAIVQKDNKIIFKEHIGLQNIEEGKPMDDHTLFRLASLTKPIVSAAALTLLDKGLIRLDDPIEKYLPEFAELTVHGQPDLEVPSISIQELLTHTSGIWSGMEQDEVGAMYRDLWGNGFNELNTFVQYISRLPLGAAPGARFTYSLSTDIIARLIEKVSGQPLEQYLREVIFQPLGMNKTGFLVAEEDVPHFATLYGLDDENHLQAVADNKESANVTGIMARGNSGLVSTVSDYLKFGQMLLQEGQWEGKQILKRETLRLFITNHLTEAQLPMTIADRPLHGLGFGLGLAVSLESNPLGRISGTYGWLGRSNTAFFADPTHKVIGILFSQYDNVKESKLIWEFNNLVYDCLNINTGRAEK